MLTSRVMSSTIFFARSPPSASTQVMNTRPSCSMSSFAPVSASIFLMILPPGPIMSPILSGWIITTNTLGAYWLRLSLGSAIVLFNHVENRHTWRLSPAQALHGRSPSTDPSILVSIWMAVTPCAGPGDLEVHVAVEVLHPLDVGQEHVLVCSSVIRPMEIPATGALIFTPASISARVHPHVLAIDVEPFDSRTSDVRSIV